MQRSSAQAQAQNYHRQEEGIERRRDVNDPVTREGLGTKTERECEETGRGRREKKWWKRGKEKSSIWLSGWLERKTNFRIQVKVPFQWFQIQELSFFPLRIKFENWSGLLSIFFRLFSSSFPPYFFLSLFSLFIFLLLFFLIFCFAGKSTSREDGF